MAVACLKGLVIALCLALQAVPPGDVPQRDRSAAGVYFFDTHSTTFGILILDYDGSFAVLYQGCFGGGLLQRGTYRVDGSLVWFQVLEGEIQPGFSVEREMHRVDRAGKRYLVRKSDLAKVISSPPLKPGEKLLYVWRGDPSRAKEDLDFFRRLVPSRRTSEGG